MNKQALLQLLDNEFNKATTPEKTMVLHYACELVETMEDNWTPLVKTLETDLLNGAKGWCQYSRDGNSLVYNSDIADRLGVSSDINGVTLLDMQARALAKAYHIIKRLVQNEDRRRVLENA